jgi:hypothetical protein
MIVRAFIIVNKQLVWPQVAPRIEEKKSEQYLPQLEAQRRSAATPVILRELKICSSQGYFCHNEN